MKKILLSALTLATVLTAFGQEAADKQFQAGITAGAGMNFQNMGTKFISNDGVGSDLFIGGTFNYMFHETIGFSSGVEFEFSKMKYVPGTSAGVLNYYFNDSKIVGMDDVSEATHMYALQARKQSATYLTIPTMLIFRTNFVGYMRYYGKLGMRHGFLLNQKSNDVGTSYAIADPSVISSQENSNMKASNEMVFYKGTIGIAGGAEWNFSGSTTLAFEIGYYYGITPLYYNRNNSYLSNYDVVTGARTPLSNKANQSQLQLKVSILF